ncbi:MAG: glycosyltransferase family 2 protein [Sphingobacteriales bacterium]|nr:glycosyltransferase family 2 protein [Sphingobacteriales bacterium]
MHPKVTILMPACNAGKYIAEAIRSVLDQSFKDYELLIVDDGSTDDTLTVIRQFKDPRIRVLCKEKEGISVALNTGLQMARATYIARFDADDICMSSRLERQVLFLDGHPAYLVIGSDAEYISENGEHLFHFRCAGHTHREIIGNLYKHCPVIHSAAMYRKEAILRIGGYSLHAHNFEDHLLWVQLLKTGKCCNLPEPLIKVRINPHSVTIDERWRGRRFRQLKQGILERGTITQEEGNELQNIILRQDNKKIKEGAYHALCGKKLLAENYRPAKARWHVTRSIYANPFRLDNYLILMVSYLPARLIKWLHQTIPQKT